MISNSRSFLIEFNNLFPLDRWYRKKYNIAFGSPQHRAISQIDIYMEWLEDFIFEEHEQEIKEKRERAKLYAQGEWITQRIDEEIEDDLFDKIKI
jgi:hypothetical protein